jgi:hypothetical protein
MPHKDPIQAAASKRAYYLAHKDDFIARSKANRLKKQEANAATKELMPKVVIQKFCPCCGTETTKCYVSKHGGRCKPCVANYQKAYREANQERIAASKKQWSIDNSAYKAAQDKLYAQQNPGKRNLARKKWMTANLGEDKASKAKNRAARLKRIPSWLTEDDKWMIAQAYELAALRTKLLGFSWHVDHIIPLNGKNVSGLHVPKNLQVIPAIDNLRKGNRMEARNG